jgi:hypothetical protein
LNCLSSTFICSTYTSLLQQSAPGIRDSNIAYVSLRANRLSKNAAGGIETLFNASMHDSLNFEHHLKGVDLGENDLQVIVLVLFNCQAS